jgi:hypothetical protein
MSRLEAALAARYENGLARRAVSALARLRQRLEACA